MEKQNENIEKIFLKTYALAWTYDFINVKYRQDRVDEYLKNFIENGKDLDNIVFLKDGVKFSLTPIILELIIDKLERFRRKQKDEELIKVSDEILRTLKEGVAPWDIPFFVGIFVRQVFYHPLSQNKKIFNLIYDFIPRKIEHPDERKEEKIIKDNIPKGYKRTDSGLVIPE